MTALNTTATELMKAIDPVCGMKVETGKTNLVSVYKGRSYRFCAENCLRAFESNPDKYLERKPGKKKGWFGRYLERMAKINKEQLGCTGIKCH